MAPIGNISALFPIIAFRLTVICKSLIEKGICEDTEISSRWLANFLGFLKKKNVQAQSSRRREEPV